MDVQAALANAIKQRFNAVNGVEAPKQTGRNSRRPEPMPKVDKASKNEARKAAAAAIMARMGGKPSSSPPRTETKAKQSFNHSKRVSNSNSSKTSSRLPLSPQEEKIAAEYRRMLKIKMPEGAVLHKMIADGVAANIRDAVMAGDVQQQTTVQARGTIQNHKQTGSVSNSSSLSPQEEKIAAQYRRMLKIKMPEGAVLHKMVSDGVSQKIQDSVMRGDAPETSSSSSSLSSSRVVGPVSSLSREEELVAAPYRKMIKMKMPEGAVRHKMNVDGVSETIQKSVLGGETPSQQAPRRPANPMAASINMSGGIESLRKGGAQSRPSAHPMAAAITSSGGIGSLKQTDAPARPPSNPMAAMIASSGGLKSLKKTSPRNTNAPPPKPKSSNSVLDELSSKGFQSGLRKTHNNKSSPYHSPDVSNSDSLDDFSPPSRASPERNRSNRPSRFSGIKVKGVRSNSPDSEEDNRPSRFTSAGTTSSNESNGRPSRFSGIKVKGVRSTSPDSEEDNRPSRFSGIKVKAVRSTSPDSEEDNRPSRFSGIKVKGVRSTSPDSEEDNRPSRFSGIKVKGVRSTSPDSEEDNRPSRFTGVKVKAVRSTSPDSEEDNRPSRFSGIKVKGVRSTSSESKEDNLPSRFTATKVNGVKSVSTSRVEGRPSWRSKDTKNDHAPQHFTSTKAKTVTPAVTPRVERSSPERNNNVQTKKNNSLPRRFTSKVKAVTPVGVSDEILPVRSISVTIEGDAGIEVQSTELLDDEPKTITSESKEKYPSRSITCRSTATKSIGSRSTASTKSTNSGFQTVAKMEKSFANAVAESMRTQRTTIDDSGRSGPRTKVQKPKVRNSRWGRKHRSITTSDGVEHHCQCTIM